MLDVLPRALLAAAADLRALVWDGTHAADVGDAALTAALAGFVDRWTPVLLDDAADTCAQRLRAAAQEYADVEALLVPGSLR